MSVKTRLYDAFGEMLYVVAMADGIIQPEEIDVLHKALNKHPFGKDIEWSFDYERLHQTDVEELYQKVLNICQENGPDPEYQKLIEIMEEVAHSSDGINTDEQKVIDRFIHELTDRFKNALKEIE
nr:TerB family tellurite resistance protein [uncultured Carboxylicivirga sp.]